MMVDCVSAAALAAAGFSNWENYAAGVIQFQSEWFAGVVPVHWDDTCTNWPGLATSVVPVLFFCLELPGGFCTCSERKARKTFIPVVVSLQKHGIHSNSGSFEP
jgi:hypothetical protein